MKLQISPDRSASLAEIEVINLELRLVLFSDAVPTVLAEDFVEWTGCGKLWHCKYISMRTHKRAAEVVRET